jgi:hypothetical protein
MFDFVAVTQTLTMMAVTSTAMTIEIMHLLYISLALIIYIQMFVVFLGRMFTCLRISGAGLRTYRRPDAKSGGHGVGWSPMTPYTFKVPQDWEEVSFQN